jgi:hypothetical protein
MSSLRSYLHALLLMLMSWTLLINLSAKSLADPHHPPVGCPFISWAIPVLQ